MPKAKIPVGFLTGCGAGSGKKQTCSSNSSLSLVLKNGSMAPSVPAEGLGLERVQFLDVQGAFRSGTLVDIGQTLAPPARSTVTPPEQKLRLRYI